MSTELGRIFIQLEAVVPELNFRDSSERDEFLSDWAKILPERLRQNVLTWQSNYHNRQCAIQDEIAKSIVPTPDYIERERARAAARKKTT